MSCLREPVPQVRPGSLGRRRIYRQAVSWTPICLKEPRPQFEGASANSPLGGARSLEDTPASKGGNGRQGSPRVFRMLDEHFFGHRMGLEFLKGSDGLGPPHVVSEVVHPNTSSSVMQGDVGTSVMDFTSSQQGNPTFSGPPGCGVGEEWTWAAQEDMGTDQTRKRLEPRSFRAQVGQVKPKWQSDLVQEVTEIISHPNYNPVLKGEGGADVALVKLGAPVRLSQGVSLVTLAHEKLTVPAGTKCWVTGWDPGALSPSPHPGPPLLLQMLWVLLLTLPFLGATMPMTPGQDCSLQVRQVKPKWQNDLFQEVTEIISHPNYNPVLKGEGGADVALVKLGAPMRLSQGVSLVTLSHEKLTVPAGTKCWVTGWVQLPAPYNLREVEVPIVDDEVCRQQYRKVKKVILKDMLCAGSSGRDSCQGDSGGPLVCKLGGTWLQMLWVLLLILPYLGGSMPMTRTSSLETKFVGIVGSHDAPPGKWPWLVGLVFWDTEDEDIWFGCEGSLIHKEWVLTAASCVEGLDPEDVQVRVGQAQHLRSGNSVKVTKIILHEDYDDEEGQRSGKDVALLKLEFPLNLSSQVQLIDLPPPEFSLPSGTKCWVMSWDELANNGPRTPTDPFGELALLGLVWEGEQGLPADKQGLGWRKPTTSTYLGLVTEFRSPSWMPTACIVRVAVLM
ncbi:PREDICTED: uncharacterized protein LOC102834522 [Chrysochloris asiatica]|uniref:Uncharacterized protein LOC102834522 n=1 Tax=Chrysochloris asiatica TaxID=185453 RepID=A0A9B0U5Q6_CHRAS|nr:PREDICTED: uncharacterized protein LOC102834522 [Chrysochloris asiatica]